MTILTLTGAPRSKRDVLDEFVEDIRARKGWRDMGEVMVVLSRLEEARTIYHLIGSRVLGFHTPKSDLDFLGQARFAPQDFEMLGHPLWEGGQAVSKSPRIQVYNENGYGEPYVVLHAKDKTQCLDFQLYWDPSRLRAWGCIVQPAFTARCVAWLYRTPKGEHRTAHWLRLIWALEDGRSPVELMRMEMEDLLNLPPHALLNPRYMR